MTTIKSRYAKGTSVTVDRSRAAISKALRDYGATGVMEGWDGDKAFVAFLHGKYQVRIVIQIPDNERRTRERYRVLLLLIKARFEMIATGSRTFEEEFLADIVMPNGQTVSEGALPTIRQAIEEGRMPQKLLPM